LSFPEVVVRPISVNARYIEKTLADLVVAHEAIRAPYFQLRNGINMPKIFVGHNPSRRYGGEETKSVALWKILRSVVSQVKLGKVFTLVAICNPAGHPQTPLGQVAYGCCSTQVDVVGQVA